MTKDKFKNNVIVDVFENCFGNKYKSIRCYKIRARV